MKALTELAFKYFLSVLCALSYPICASAAGTTFEKTCDALVIVAAGQAVGSGFVLQMDGKRYLITNEHVLRGGQSFSATLLNGSILTLKTLEIAADRDLVRMEIATDNAALALSTDPLAIGEDVLVYGNSVGGGVATSISGKLLGIGPKLIEVDAAFVGGNSGSQILNAKGSVLGVATFATRDQNPNDWVKQGTRFTKVRRFGVRLNDVQWKTVDATQYFLRSDALADIETFCIDLYNLRFTDKFITTSTKIYNYQFVWEKKRYRRYVGLCALLAESATTFNRGLQSERSAKYYAEQCCHYSVKGQRKIDAQRQATMDAMLANQFYQEHEEAYKKVYAKAAGFIRYNDWLIPSMKDDAIFWLEVLKILTNKIED